MKITNKIKWQDWSALALLTVLVLTVPISNAFIAGATNQILTELVKLIDIAFNQVSLAGMTVIQSVATLLLVYIVWKTHTLTKNKIPKKSSGKVGAYEKTAIK